MASAAIVLTTASRFLADELHVQPGLALGIEAGLQVGEADVRRKRRSSRASSVVQEKRRSATILASPRLSSARAESLYAETADFAAWAFAVGAALALLERLDLRARVRDLAPVLGEEPEIGDEQGQSDAEEQRRTPRRWGGRPGTGAARS